MAKQPANNLFCYAALADKNKNTVYLDATGRFPCTSMEGMQYMLVVYDYTSNAIIIETINNLEAKTICDAYTRVYMALKEKWCEPMFNFLNT